VCAPCCQNVYNVQVSYAARLASTPQLSLVQTQAGREPLGFLDCFRGWSSAAAAAAGTTTTTTAGGAATTAATAGTTADSVSKPAAAQFEALDFAALGTEDSDDEAEDTVTTLHDTAAVATALTQLPTAATATVQQQQQQQQQPPQWSARALPPLPPAATAVAAGSAGRASLAPPTAAAAASATTTTSSTTTAAGARSRNVSFGPDGRPDSDACFSLGVDLVSGLDSVDFNALNNNSVGSPLTSEGGYSTRSNSPPRSPLSDCGSDGGAAKSRRSTSKHAQQAAAQKRQSGAESARRRQQQRQARQSLGSSGHSAGSGKRYSSTAAGRRISSFFRSVCRVSLAPAAADDDHDGDATASTSGRSPRVSLAPLSRTGSWVSVSAGVESDVRAAAAVRQQQQQQSGQALSRSAHARLPPRSSSSRAKRGDPFAAADAEHAAASAATAAVLDPTVAPTPLRHSAPPKPSGLAAAITTAAGTATAGEAAATATATKRDRVSNLRALHVALVSITVPVCSQPYSSIAVRTSAVAVAVMMTLTPYSALCKPRRVCNGMQRMLRSLIC
jgi:hypothetical protein